MHVFMRMHNYSRCDHEPLQSTYIQTYILTYLHTIQTYMHTYIHTYIHRGRQADNTDNTDIHAIHPYTHADRSTDGQTDNGHVYGAGVSTLSTQQVLRTLSTCCKYLGSHHQRRRFSEAHLFLHEVAAHIYIRSQCLRLSWLV